MKRLVLPIICTVTLLALCVGMYIGMQITSRGLMPSTFWDVKFIEVFQLCVGIILAVVVTYVISTHINYNLKQRELVAGCVAEYEESLRKIYDSFAEYSRTPTKDKAQHILRLHKTASNCLDIMLGVLASSNAPATITSRENHENNYMRLKSAITDSPFGSDKKQISDLSRLDRIDTAFCAVRKSLVQCKLALYS